MWTISSFHIQAKPETGHYKQVYLGCMTGISASLKGTVKSVDFLWKLKDVGFLNKQTKKQWRARISSHSSAPISFYVGWKLWKEGPKQVFDSKAYWNTEYVKMPKPAAGLIGSQHLDNSFCFALWYWVICTDLGPLFMKFFYCWTTSHRKGFMQTKLSKWQQPCPNISGSKSINTVKNNKPPQRLPKSGLLGNPQCSALKVTRCFFYRT